MIINTSKEEKKAWTLCEKGVLLALSYCLMFLLTHLLSGSEKMSVIIWKGVSVKQMWSLEKKGGTKYKAWGCRQISLPWTHHHNSKSSVRCQVWPLDRNTHTHTHTHKMSLAQGERVPQSQISQPSKLWVQDTGRVNLIRKKIRPWQNEWLLLCVHKVWVHFNSSFADPK